MSLYWSSKPIPKPFWIKKLHSLTGVFLVLFLIQHLLTNSQASLWFGEDGIGFVRAVNGIHEIPFLTAIEILFLAVPFCIHGYWGILYAKNSKMNAFSPQGNVPSLERYKENRYFTWQRITSWLVLVGVILHVIHMRFWQYPSFSQVGKEKYYIVSLSNDPGLETLSYRLGFTLYDQKKISSLKEKLSKEKNQTLNPLQQEKLRQEKNFLKDLQTQTTKSDKVAAVSSSFGLADLLVVREAFKSFWMILLYSVFVLATTFHAFNGLWTSMISFGVTLTKRSQNGMRYLSNVLFVLVLFLGLAAIWGSYWINLYS